MPILFRDFESRSLIDLQRVGAWKYSTHPTTEVQCCAYAVDAEPVKLWVPGDPTPPEFIEAANNDSFVVSAFNDSFERLIEAHIMAPRYGWPIIPIERHRCTQASAQSLALPSSLDKVAAALGLSHQKDKTGATLMLAMSKPRKPREDEDQAGTFWFDDPERRERLYAYCRQDVETERELYHRIGFISADEQKIWELDAIINDRGVQVDLDLIRGALKLGEEAHRRTEVELHAVTGGVVETIGQVARIAEWLASHGCDLKDLRKETVSATLSRDDIPAEARRVLELRRDAVHAAANKFKSMLNWEDDGRVRGAFKYHAASTGRWTSNGIQLHNMKRPDTQDMAGAIKAVTTGSLEELIRFDPLPAGILGDVTRAVFIAAPGHQLISADYSAIESRVAAWAAGQLSKVAQWAKFDQTGDPEDEPYMIVGRALGFKDPKTARDKGKTADLAFGYAGGIGAYRKSSPNDPTTDVEIEKYKKSWRNQHPAIVNLWERLNSSAIKAVQTGQNVKVNEHLSFRIDREFLKLRLPSGRELSYPFPTLITESRGGHAVSFMDNSGGKYAATRKGRGMYGGVWCNNCVQAIARDLLAAAMQRIEAAGYRIVLHIHDQVVAEMPLAGGGIDEFKKIISGVA